MKNIKTFENFNYDLLEKNVKLDRFSYDNYINESIMDTIKSYAKKGVLTVAILANLLGNSTYAQTQKDAIENSVKTEIVKPGPMEEFLNKYAGDEYFIAKGESKYDLETAEAEARLEISKHQLEQSGKDQLRLSGKDQLRKVEEKVFKVDGKYIYIIVCKNK